MASFSRSWFSHLYNGDDGKSPDLLGSLAAFHDPQAYKMPKVLSTQLSEHAVCLDIETILLPLLNSRYVSPSLFPVSFQTPLLQRIRQLGRQGDCRKRQMPPHSGWLLAYGELPSVTTSPSVSKETGNPNFTVKSHVLNVGNSFFKTISPQADETKHENRKNEVPGLPLCGLHVKFEGRDRTMRGMSDKKPDSKNGHKLRVHPMSPLDLQHAREAGTPLPHPQVRDRPTELPRLRAGESAGLQPCLA